MKTKIKNKTMNQRKFRRYLTKFPKVWKMFETFTFDRINKGHSKYSADSILHRIRWESPVEKTGGEEYKINNNISSYMARHFIRKHPKHKEFFELRHQPSKD
jgi:hypothetical protein